MNNIQERLNDLYTEYLNEIFSDKELYEQILNFKISSPILLNSQTDFGKYLESDYKILYVGKETSWWFNQNERRSYALYDNIQDIEKYLNGLTELYKNFNLGHKYKYAIFTFMDILVDKLRNVNPMTGILWTNVLRHDGFRGKVPFDVENKITYNHNYIFRKEIEILNPDAIVFVTGPNYDYLLNKTFDGLEKNKVENWSLREISILNHKNIPNKAVRVYHPDAHKYKGSQYRLDLADEIIKIIKKE